ncbi:Mediator of RNA polymerase II transcription subunit [Dirofilaria immitis]
MNSILHNHAIISHCSFSVYVCVCVCVCFNYDGLITFILFSSIYAIRHYGKCLRYCYAFTCCLLSLHYNQSTSEEIIQKDKLSRTLNYFSIQLLIDRLFYG